MEELNLAGEAFNFSNEIQLTVLELVEKKFLRRWTVTSSRKCSIRKPRNQAPIFISGKGEEASELTPAHTIDEGLEKRSNGIKAFFQK